MIRKRTIEVGTDKPAGDQLSFIPSDVLYDDRFLESHAGQLVLSDPKTAITELIANAWDAGATEVEIKWPGPGIPMLFSIRDNGCGMTDAEFMRRWRTLSYNRENEQGRDVTFPVDLASGRARRTAFGRNGVGRWSGFCFGRAYHVDTIKDGHRNRYRVERGHSIPFEITAEIRDEIAAGHGTTVEVAMDPPVLLTAEALRAEIGMRFLTDPGFSVSVNGVTVDFEHIDDPNITRETLHLADGNTVELIIIDTRQTDRTARQHGVAWHVCGRLVGACSWKGTSADEIIDGRRIAAKRFTFIVRANHPAIADAIRKDWSGFEKENEAYLAVATMVYARVREYLVSVSEEDRKAVLEEARRQNADLLRKMGPLSRERWNGFVTTVQLNCPSIREPEVVMLSEIMANMEQSKSGYRLLNQLSALGPDQLDDLHRLLEDWTLEMAKEVLDEVAKRLKLIEELSLRVRDEKAEEVQELQPLFEKGLWIFGPEFETIEYTSNKGMTRIVKDLFKQADAVGSKNRPDFVVLPDGSAGFYSYPKYDREGGEIGVAELVVIELKKPFITIGEVQKGQCWKYVKEFYEKGMLQQGVTRVRCFVVGSAIDPQEVASRKEKDDTVIIQPILFDTVLRRAESRMLNLRERVRDAPFIEAHRTEIDQFLNPEDGDMGLFAGTGIVP